VRSLRGGRFGGILPPKSSTGDVFVHQTLDVASPVLLLVFFRLSLRPGFRYRFCRELLNQTVSLGVSALLCQGVNESTVAVLDGEFIDLLLIHRI